MRQVNIKKPDRVFIIGVEKGGTTALAGWLVKNGLAEYAVPGVKESDHYSAFAPAAPIIERELPILDASIGYFTNSLAMSRLPVQGSRIVVCLRNPFERTWSSYKMKKLVVQQGEGADLIRSRVHSAAGTYFKEGQTTYQKWKAITKNLSDPEIGWVVEKYFDEEADRIMQGSFLQRIEYESAFLAARRQFPFLSILWCSYYYHGLRMVLDKYPPEDVLVLTMNTLHTPHARNELTERLLGMNNGGAELDFVFTSRDIEFDEPKPDFSSADFDFLRKIFNYDLQQTFELLRSRGTCTDFIDSQELWRHIV